MQSLKIVCTTEPKPCEWRGPLLDLQVSFCMIVALKSKGACRPSKQEIAQCMANTGASMKQVFDIHASIGLGMQWKVLYKLC